MNVRGSYFSSKIFSIGCRALALSLVLAGQAWARIQDYSPDQAAQISWIALNFPVSNHFSLRNEEVNFDRRTDNWAAQWMSTEDPRGIYFLGGDRAAIARDFGNCITSDQRLLPNIFSNCALEAEKLLTQRLEEFRLSTAALISTVTLENASGFFDDPAGRPRFEESPENRQNKVSRLLRERLIEDRLAGKSQDEAMTNLRRWLDEVFLRHQERNNILRVQNFVNAFYETFDPHSKFMGPERSNELSSQLDAESVGLGINLSKNEIGEIVAQPLPGSPAESAGIFKNDVLVGTYTDDFSTFIPFDRISPLAASQLINRSSGEATRLKIRRSASNEDGLKSLREFDVQIVNQPVSLDYQTVRAKVFVKGKRKVVVFSAGQFYTDIAADLAEMLRIVTQVYGIPDGVVLDLSGNPGGLLEQAQAVAGLFVKPSIVAQTSTIERTVFGSVFQTKNLFSTGQNEEIYDGPLVVKIDQDSASASEIVAAFLQDSGRALVVGHRSYGKGTIQRLFPAFHSSLMPLLDHFADEINFLLPNTPDSERFDFGSIRMTVGKYYRINGTTTQSQGVRPNLYLYPRNEEQSDHYESSLDNVLTADNIDPVLNLKNIGNRFVRNLTQHLGAWQSRISANVDLRAIDNLIQQQRSQALQPRSLDLNLRLKQQKSEIQQGKALLSRLKNSATLAGVQRIDFYQDHGHIKTTSPVSQFEDSSDAQMARFVSDPDNLEKMKFSFEKSRIEMNEVLGLFFSP